jgi:phage tail sheath protein FI
VLDIPGPTGDGSGAPRIEAVSTSTAGVVGPTLQGPAEPTQVRSYVDFERIYGGAVAGSHLGEALRGFFNNGGRDAFVARATDSTAPALITALGRLATVEEVSLLLVPDESAARPAVADAVMDQCEQLGDRFAVLSAPEPTRQSAFAAAYGPWLDTGSGGVPPVGHVAGLIARTDLERGVALAPTGVLQGVRGLAAGTPGATGRANEIRVVSGRGTRVWGSRTLSDDPEWKYVNVRRFFIFLEESIDNGTQWVMFEPNGEALWTRLRAALTEFLLRQWQSGFLAGSTPDEAFSVRCDRTTMTQDDLDDGRLVCLVGVAPLRPAEFVVIGLRQIAIAPGPPATPGSPPGRSG